MRFLLIISLVARLRSSSSTTVATGRESAGRKKMKNFNSCIFIFLKSTQMEFLSSFAAETRFYAESKQGGMT